MNIRKRKRGDILTAIITITRTKEITKKRIRERNEKYKGKNNRKGKENRKCL